MNDLIMSLGLEGWKPLVTALLLPPAPFLLLVLVGARLMFRRRLLAWCLVLLGVAGVWFSATPAVGKLMRQTLHPVPLPISDERIAELAKGGDNRRTAIVVLGGGSRDLSPEYGMSNLTPASVERLRYGIWLARQTKLPLAFTGGLGHGARPGATEAEIASRMAEQEFRFPLRWTEDRSRDTAENGLLTVPLLKADGIQRVVLVSHDYHMRRVLRAFERGAAHSQATMRFELAPMGMRPPHEWELADFLPSRGGFYDNHLVLHEWLGYLLGA
ncbi:MAG: YdcF family protein [Rubrivivax sp.]|nr:YdcF family protein [Rubrivivax sp.]